MPSTHGGHCPFPYAVIISVLNLLQHSCIVLEADFVGCSHLSSGITLHLRPLKVASLFTLRSVFLSFKSLSSFTSFSSISFFLISEYVSASWSTSSHFLAGVLLVMI